MNEPYVRNPILMENNDGKKIFNQVLHLIADYEKQLDDEHEIGLELCNFVNSTVMNIEQIGLCEPCLMVFYGTINNKPAQLIQHTSQVNILLTTVEKEDPNEKPRRVIGFQP